MMAERGEKEKSDDTNSRKFCGERRRGVKQSEPAARASKSAGAPTEAFDTR